MKKIRIALLASLVCLFAASCDKQEADTPIYSANRFRVEAPQFLDENGQKVYLHYTDMASSLIYEEGEKVYINGHSFTLVQDGGWCAVSDDGNPISGKRFLVAYADGDVNNFDSAAGTYHYNLNANLGYSQHNKIVLGGVAENNGDYVITLQPACAILRINTQGAGASYSGVKVGFEANKIPKQGTINVTNRNLSAGSNSNYLTGVTSGGAGDFLYMRYSSPATTGESDYWYVAIPIEGSSVNTTLYLEWNNGSTTVQHKTQGQVTLQKGYVYTLGTDRQSPFNADGTSKCYFKVASGMTKYVSFSPGNLIGKLIMSGGAHTEWEFASRQDYYVGTNNEANMFAPGSPYDLFGYGTSDWSGRASYTSSDELSDYANFDLTGANANADWGVYNGSTIKYGSTPSGTTWRTLTSAEWNYLINTRSGKGALATVNGKKGLILLPDLNASSSAWVYDDEISAPRPSFTPGYTNYTTNNYTQAEWDKLESAGVIFLPAAGTRYGDVDATSTDMVTTHGFYWSSTYGSSNQANQANALVFTNGSASITATDNLISNGCSVRLVHQQW